MRLLVLSDTHGDIEKAEQAINKTARIDLILHLGDYFRDAQKLSSIFPGIPVEYIHGNCDFMIEDVPAERLLILDGKRIFMTHGHRYSVKWSYDNLYRKAEELNADILLFGHTHVAEIIWRGSFFLVNPGSISESRNGRSESYAVVDITSGGLDPKLLYL